MVNFKLLGFGASSEGWSILGCPAWQWGVFSGQSTDLSRKQQDICGKVEKAVISSRQPLLDKAVVTCFIQK